MADKFDLNDWMGRWDVAIPAAGYAELVSRIRALESASQPGSGEGEPTEAMIDAARPLFLALECEVNTIEGARREISHCGRRDISYLPEWFRTGTGHLTKAGRAIIAWHMMNRAAPSAGNGEAKGER